MLALVGALAAGVVNAAPRSFQMLSEQTGLSKRGSFMTGKQVAVYWGQSTQDLSDVCSSGDYNVVILSFITSLIPPKLNLGKDTGSASTAQAKQSGWELFDGTVAASGGSSVASQITACQAKGIKVMISFGGTNTVSNSTFASASDAKTAAGYVWYVLYFREYVLFHDI